MLVKLQGNLNSTFENPLQNNWDDIIYCNTGGKPNMSLMAKNIPPMLTNDIPEEIQIRDSANETIYSKIKSYSSNCFKDELCHTETPFFRFQLVYDGFDFLYYPEFKLYERPYVILESSYQIGVDTMIFSGSITTAHDNLKNLGFVEVGDIVRFVDTNDSYTITEKEVVGGNIVMVFDEAISVNHYINDVMVIINKKYENAEDSNIMNDSTTSSAFKIKFVNTASLNSKNQTISQTAKISTTQSVLYNDNQSQIADLQSDDKIVSLSKNINIAMSNIVLNSDIDTAGNEVIFTAPITSHLNINSYFTLKSTTNIEIFRVTEILDNMTVRVARGQLNSTAADFTAADVKVYFPLYIYFQMVPFNKYIDFRYVVYRNIDFVLTQV